MQVLGGYGFSQLQGRMDDSGLTNQNDHCPRLGAWFQDGQVALPEAKRYIGISAGHAGKEDSIPFTGLELLAAILPPCGTSS